MANHRKSGHSELLGSFIRTGNFPIEADYIFETERELIEYYEDSINATTTHHGLLRVVKEDSDGAQSLFWVINKEGKLVVEKLISNVDITNIRSEIIELLQRVDANTELFNGVVEWIGEQGKRNKEYEALIRLIIGVDESSDLRDELNKMNYKSIKVIDEFLTKFYDSDTSKIFSPMPNWSTLNEIFKDYDTSKSINATLNELWVKIMGDSHPDDLYDSLMKLRRRIKDLEESFGTLDKDTKEEIDAIESAVGLHGTGKYKADPSAIHTKNATSVMDALAILDKLIDSAIKNQGLTTKDTSSVKLDVKELNDSNELSANVRISPEAENVLSVKDNGLYTSVGMTYDKGQVSLLVNGLIKDTFNIGLNSLVKSIKYDPSQESIVFEFKNTTGDIETIVVPVSNLIGEWEVDNSTGNNVVHLTKRRVTGQGSDMLSGDVRIFEGDSNILTRKERALYVDGRSTNLYHGNKLLSQVLNGLQSDGNILTASISDLKQKLEKEVDNRTIEVGELNDKITVLAGKVNTNASDITSIKEVNTEHTDSLRNLFRTTGEQQAQLRQLSSVAKEFEALKSQLSDIDLGEFNID